MRILAAFVVAVAVLSWAAPAGADVQLHIENGQVSLKATNATVRDILAEWARVGQTRIVNGERVPGGPITIELNGVSEEQALEIILRSAAGYVTAPRASSLVNASRYDRILVMPTSSPTRPGPTPPQPGQFPQAVQPGQFPPPVPQQFPGQFQPQRPPQVPPQQYQGVQFPPTFPPQRPVDDDGDVQDDPAPNVVMPNSGQPVFGVNPPSAQPASPFGARPPAGQPPVGVSTPGMVVPAPQQQQVPPGTFPPVVPPQEP